MEGRGLAGAAMEKRKESMGNGVVSNLKFDFLLIIMKMFEGFYNKIRHSLSPNAAI